VSGQRFALRCHAVVVVVVVVVDAAIAKPPICIQKRRVDLIDPSYARLALSALTVVMLGIYLI